MSHEEEFRRRAVAQARRQQREASERARRSQDIGREFHYGIAELRGETCANGWLHEQPVTVEPGRTRVHDAVKVNTQGGRDFVEYKCGRRVGGAFHMDQMAKDRRVLECDEHARGTWVLLKGSADVEARRELDQMVQDFPGRFRVVEVTRELAAKARDVGMRLERGRHQMELVDSGKLRRLQRIKERREKLQEKERTRDAARQAVERADRERRTHEADRRQRDAAGRLAASARRERAANARGERLPMTGREVRDILVVTFPMPPVPISPQRERPSAGSASLTRARERADRERGLSRER
ncbi:hypothetical protein [Nocardia farcinica]